MNSSIKSTIPENAIPYILPSNWKWYYWSDLIVDYQQGLIRSNNELGDGNVYYLKMGDLDNNGSYSLNNISTTKADKNEIEGFILKENDFLINVRNSFELVGKSCVIEETYGKVILFNHMLVRITHNVGISNHFINAYLNIPSSKRLIDRCKQGTTTVIALYQRDLFKLPISIPDNNTLNYITNFYKKLNSKINLNSRINAELESMAKTLYNYWFVQFDFPNENGNPYKSSGGKMVWNQKLKREIPEFWDDGTLEDISELVRGVSYNTNDIKKETDNGVIPILRATNISGNIIDLENMVFVPSEKVSLKQILNMYDILIVMSSGSKEHIGKNGFFYFDKEVAFGTFCAKLVAKDNFQYYLYSYTQSDFMFTTIKNECLGTNINNLNGTLVNGFKILLPPNDLIEDFNEKVSSLYEKIGNNTNENQKLTELRDWLLPMLMNGQVKVRDSAEKKNIYKTKEEISMAAEPENIIIESDS